MKKISKLKLQEIYFELKETLNDELMESFNVFKVKQPIYFKGEMPKKNIEYRGINFDMSQNEEIYTIFNEFDGWAIDFLDKNEIKNNNGIMLNLNYIQRDSLINNFSDIEKDTISIYMRYDGDNIEEKIHDLVYQVYSIIVKVNEKKYEKDFYNKILKKYSLINLKKEYSKYIYKINDEEIFKEILQRKGASLIQKEDFFSLRHQLIKNEENIEILKIKEIKDKINAIVIEIDLLAILILVIKNISKEDVMNNIFY